jgi:thymidine phosphorylase
MDVPLGRSVGNAIEIIESIELLKGRGPDDVAALVVTLATRVLVLSGRYTDADAEPAVRRALASGEALEKLRAMIAWQGGDVRVLEDYSLLQGAARRQVVVAQRDGYLASLRADLVGRAAMALGAGRRRIGDPVDHGVGVLIAKKPGERVRAEDTVLELLYNNEDGLDEASALAVEAIRVDAEPPVLRPLVLGVVT